MDGSVQPFLLGAGWVEMRDGDESCRAIFDRHYSRYVYGDGRKPKLFVGPGEKTVLMRADGLALFVWRKFIDASGQEGVNCAIFRNEGDELASDLILEAETVARRRWPDDRLYTYVDPAKVRPTMVRGHPVWGWCYYRAGWTFAAVTKSGKIVLHKLAGGGTVTPGPRPGIAATLRAVAPIVTRPAARWYGGKWRLAPWIIAHFPEHRCYVEPYGGGASVLIRKPRSAAEIYNDLDSDIVNLFRVLRDRETARQLGEALRLTPFAREEFLAAYALTDEPLERARRLVILAFMGFGSNAHSRTPTGFRSNSTRSGTTPAHDWANSPTALPALVERLQGVTIEHRTAMEVMAQHDAPTTLHYLDPPYVHATLSDDGHRELLAFARTLKGMVVLSGYPHEIYEQQLGDWRRVERIAMADGARPRVEVLWLNPACVAAASDGPLIDRMRA